MIVGHALVGILAAIVVPSYLAHIQKANRVAAQLALTKMAQQFERTSARQGDYPTSASVPTASSVIAAIDSPDTYTFSAPVSTTDTFTLQAEPIGSSAGDECGTLSIKQTGETTSSSSSGCW